MAGPQSIPYTEFKTQVANKNVSEVFARGNAIQGALRKPSPLPPGQESPGRQSRIYQQFTTERPTFAAADLLNELATGARMLSTKQG